MPTRHHVEIAHDELLGMQELGYAVGDFHYAAKDGYSSAISRIYIIVKNAFNLIGIAYSFKPDIVYFNSRLEVLAGIRDFITILMLKAFYWRKVKIVLKSHGSDLTVLNSHRVIIKKVILPFLKKNVSAWLFLSQEEKVNIINSGFLPASRVFVTKNIVRIDHFKPTPAFKIKHGIAEGSKILLFVGRIIREKGIYEVLEAFKKIDADEPLVLIVVGDGAEYEHIRREYNTAQSGGRIVFTGFIPEQQVVDYYANSDMLVFPTYFPEGFPMALFNSVAAGLSIVTTATRAASDYLTEPENCLWVEPQDSDSVADAVTKILKLKALESSMKFNNLRKAELFSRSRVAGELSEIFNQIV